MNKDKESKKLNEVDEKNASKESIAQKGKTEVKTSSERPLPSDIPEYVRPNYDTGRYEATRPLRDNDRYWDGASIY